MSKNAVEITAEEAIAALRAGAWTERVDAEYQHAKEASGNALYLDADGQVRDAPSFIAAPAGWRPLYLDVTPQGRKRIHCQMSFTGGADWDLDQAIELVEKATEIAWVDHLLSHDLAVMAEGCAHYFDVQCPRDHPGEQQ
jgi:hypothetical protein